jgi:WD40 repeat protein
VRRTWLVAAIALLALPGAADAAFPGKNGVIAFDTCGAQPGQYCQGQGIGTIDPAGGPITGVASGRHPSWSADGTKIVYSNGHTIQTMTPTGTVLTTCPCPTSSGSPPFVEGTYYLDPFWSPDGIRIGYYRNDFTHDEDNWSLAVGTPGGSQQSAIFAGYPYGAAWSPDGNRIYSGGFGIASWSPGAASYQTVLADSAVLSGPNTSPDGTRIVYSRSPASGPFENAIYVVQTDGTGVTRLSPPAPANDYSPAWSPDGTKIVFVSERDGNPELYVMNSDGTNQTRITDTPTQREDNPDWQPLSVPYPRPKGATPVRVSLVPAYRQCTSPDRTHGPPLAFGSCSSPAQESGELTVGDTPANMTGFVRYETVLGNPATPADEADLALRVQITDVREQGTLADYVGEVEAQAMTRMTDHEGAITATAGDVRFPLTTQCSPTADTSIGSTCSLTTTLDTLIPGAVVERARTILQLGQVRVVDGGPDGDTATEPNTVFLKQGVFVP